MPNREKNNGQTVREEFQAYGQYGYTYSGPAGDAGAAPAGATGARPAAGKPAGRQPQGVRSSPKKRNSNSFFFHAFVLITLLTVGLVVVMQAVFRLEAVRIVGHQTHTAHQIINASGLTYGQNIFTITPEKICASLEKDHTLIVKDVRIKYPNMVYLQVEERYPVALMQWLGVYYVLDKDGLVMEETKGDELLGTMPLVTDFRVTSAHKGQFLKVKSQLQLSAYTDLILELRAQGYARYVSEIRLGDPENIYLVTTEGISVRIGRPEDLKRKVQAIRTASSYLRALDEHDGVLDVNVPTDVKYRADP